MITAALFDLDGTLFDRDAALRAFAAAQHARFRAAWPNVSQEYYVAHLLALDQRGAVWKDRVYQALVQETGANGVTWGELLADYEAGFPAHGQAFPFAREVLATLRERGFRLALITNGLTRLQSRVLRALALEDYFEAVLISEAEGVRKPAPEIFLRALRRLHARPEQAVMIGDNPVADIASARAVGLRTVWKPDPPSLAASVSADATLRCLSELPALLDRWNAA